MSEYRNIDLSAWTKVGEGGNGVTYENPSQSDIILKVNKPRLSCLDTVKHEYEVSQAVERLGLPTPKMYEMVRVGDAYATIAQRIKHKKSLSRSVTTSRSASRKWLPYCASRASSCLPPLATPPSFPAEESRCSKPSARPLLFRAETGN